MRKAMGLVLAALTGAVLIGGASAAVASHADVIRRGPCSASSDWKLKLSPEDGKLEVEFEVDSNVVGQTWRVRIRQNGTLIHTSTERTTAPSGSFEVEILAKDTAGTDTFRARGFNPGTDETCVGRASI
jgi:hypothetical protein